mmetsp:Transcript_14671/g.37506  ORF Transcript_14671/g.37506 Transcript_14671/m.37506 type:complete len:204 (-) Transcript_14671:10-621(-)
MPLPPLYRAGVSIPLVSSTSSSLASSSSSANRALARSSASFDTAETLPPRADRNPATSPLPLLKPSLLLVAGALGEPMGFLYSPFAPLGRHLSFLVGVFVMTALSSLTNPSPPPFFSFPSLSSSSSSLAAATSASVLKFRVLPPPLKKVGTPSSVGTTRLEGELYCCCRTPAAAPSLSIFRFLRKGVPSSSPFASSSKKLANF